MVVIVGPAPKIPPTLNIPWKPDIVGLRSARSTSTAMTLIVLSIAPMPAPKTNGETGDNAKRIAVAKEGQRARYQ
ncbi:MULTISPECIES: hypothetical protein [unclassified Rhizobium]|uniref:hypothetical protein n=1 Tax=unclassified Rhizobium TaxID=2613769 RepID=UPI001179C48A|nr:MULTISPECIES: hypothetical protein [unclassified Rhizobium]MDF0661656.1 hypothetical protein [Rhizobium sp. BC49]